MKAWLKIIIPPVILTSLIIVASYYNSYFSPTYVTVVDGDGKVLAGAKVSITYLCKNFINIEVSTSVLLITPNKIADANGEVRFDSYLGRPNLKGCEKFVYAYKEGYCKDQRLCANALASPGFNNVPASEQENYYYYNESYYDSFYFLERVKIPSKQRNIKLTLNKLD